MQQFRPGSISYLRREEVNIHAVRNFEERRSKGRRKRSNTHNRALASVNCRHVPIVSSTSCRKFQFSRRKWFKGPSLLHSFPFRNRRREEWRATSRRKGKTRGFHGLHGDSCRVGCHANIWHPRDRASINFRPIFNFSQDALLCRARETAIGRQSRLALVFLLSLPSFLLPPPSFLFGNP